MTSSNCLSWLKSRCTQLTSDMTRLVLENLTLLARVLAAGLDGRLELVRLRLVYECTMGADVMTLCSSDVAKVFPQPGSKHLVEVYHLAVCWVLLFQFLHGGLLAP